MCQMQSLNVTIETEIFSCTGKLGVSIFTVSTGSEYRNATSDNIIRCDSSCFHSPIKHVPVLQEYYFITFTFITDLRNIYIYISKYKLISLYWESRAKNSRSYIRLRDSSDKSNQEEWWWEYYYIMNNYKLFMIYRRNNYGREHRMYLSRE